MNTDRSSFHQNRKKWCQSIHPSVFILPNISFKEAMMLEPFSSCTLTNVLRTCRQNAAMDWRISILCEELDRSYLQSRVLQGLNRSGNQGLRWKFSALIEASEILRPHHFDTRHPVPPMTLWITSRNEEANEGERVTEATLRNKLDTQFYSSACPSYSTTSQLTGEGLLHLRQAKKQYFAQSENYQRLERRPWYFVRRHQKNNSPLQYNWRTPMITMLCVSSPTLRTVIGPPYSPIFTTMKCGLIALM